MVFYNHQYNAANFHWSKSQFQLELSLAQFSPSLFCDLCFLSFVFCCLLCIWLGVWTSIVSVHAPCTAYIVCTEHAHFPSLIGKVLIRYSFFLKTTQQILKYFASNIVNPPAHHNSTQPNITLSWVRHKNDFAHHPTPHPQKLNVSNISAVTDPILMKL